MSENNIEIGMLTDEQCNRNGCAGIMEDCRNDDFGCTCHVNPPCSYCTDNDYTCDTCGANVNEEYYEADKAKKDKLK